MLWYGKALAVVGMIALGGGTRIAAGPNRTRSPVEANNAAPEAGYLKAVGLPSWPVSSIAGLRREVIARETYRIRGDRWTIQLGRLVDPSEGSGAGVPQYVEIRRNGRRQVLVPAEKLGGTLAAVRRMWFPVGFPVFAVRVHTGASHGQLTRFYGLTNRHLTWLGDIEGECGGPIFRDFDHDGRKEWIFDDYDYIGYYGKGPRYYLIYKTRKSGQLYLWRRLLAPGRAHLPYVRVRGDDEW